jgi:hypothetical protein
VLPYRHKIIVIFTDRFLKISSPFITALMQPMPAIKELLNLLHQ